MATDETAAVPRNRVTAADRNGVDGSTLTERIGLDDAEIRWRKEFTGFDETDIDALVAMEDEVDASAEAVVEDFYDNLQSFDETVEIFGRSSKSVEQLKRTQEQYLRDLVAGDYGR